MALKFMYLDIMPIDLRVLAMLECVCVCVCVCYMDIPSRSMLYAIITTLFCMYCVLLAYWSVRLSIKGEFVLNKA